MSTLSCTGSWMQRHLHVSLLHILEPSWVYCSVTLVSLSLLVSPLSCTGSWMQGTCSCIMYGVQCTLYRQLYAGGTCIYMLLVTSVRLVMYRQLDAGGSSSLMQQSRSSLTFHITQECNSPLCSHSQGELPTLCM